ncbi:MAG: copper resistance protein CopB [Peredibacter sp.]|nr:copper resistance protein CopB [Peredibacter sp.]
MIRLIAWILFISPSVFPQSPHHHLEDRPDEIEPFERGFPKYFHQKKSPKIIKGVQKYALDEDTGEPGPTNFDTTPVEDNQVFGFFYVDRLEERFEDKNDVLLWDAFWQIGPDYHKFFFETEGTYNTELGREGSSRNEFLYGYLVDSFWFAQVGYRKDLFYKKDDREFLVLSAMGMAPFQFEVDAAAYLGDEGELSTILEVEYGFRLSQRSMLIPRFEVEAYTEKIKEYNIGKGINGYEFGVRLTYQIVREFAPYIGVSWEEKVFETADLLKESGEDTNEALFLIGARMAL